MNFFFADFVVYIKVKCDHRSKLIGKKKPEKNQGFNGIRTHDLRDTGAMLYQLSYDMKPHIGSKVNLQ